MGKGPKYPKLVVDLSKCQDTIDIEGKVHTTSGGR